MNKEYQDGFRAGYFTGIREACQRVQLLVSDQAFKLPRMKHVGVHPDPEGGLYCLDCGASVANTANHEMRTEGAFAHGHVCQDVKEEPMNRKDGK